MQVVSHMFYDDYIWIRSKILKTKIKTCPLNVMSSRTVFCSFPVRNLICYQNNTHTFVSTY